MMRPPEARNFTCPEGRLFFNSGRIRLDPTFYDHRYCICDADFYGDEGLCQKCMEGGSCHRIDFHETVDLRPSIMKIGSGYWPSPEANNVTTL